MRSSIFYSKHSAEKVKRQIRAAETYEALKKCELGPYLTAGFSLFDIFDSKYVSLEALETNKQAVLMLEVFARFRAAAGANLETLRTGEYWQFDRHVKSYHENLKNSTWPVEDNEHVIEYYREQCKIRTAKQQVTMAVKDARHLRDRAQKSLEEFGFKTTDPELNLDQDIQDGFRRSFLV